MYRVEIKDNDKSSPSFESLVDGEFFIRADIPNPALCMKCGTGYIAFSVGHDYKGGTYTPHSPRWPIALMNVRIEAERA